MKVTVDIDIDLADWAQAWNLDPHDEPAIEADIATYIAGALKAHLEELGFTKEQE